MFKFCAIMRNLRQGGPSLVLALMICTPPAHARFSNPVCRDDLTAASEVKALQSWNELPAVTEGELPVQLRAMIDAHPLTLKLKSQFADGEALNFQSRMHAQNRGGWLIQGHLLHNLIKYIFPKAHFSETISDHLLKLVLDDSTFGPLGDNPWFDMVDLKILNRGPTLPDTHRLRTMMGLPQGARIASVYEAIKTSMDKRNVLRAILDQRLADIIILSSQTDARDRRRFGWHGQVPFMSSQEWLLTEPKDRPARVIIFNDTTLRLPFVHAAADFVVVMGEANMFEPIRAGRPLYFDPVGWAHPSAAFAWKRITGVAVRSGLGHPFLTPEDLIEQRSASTLNAATGGITREDEEVALMNVLRTLSKIVTQ